MKEVMVNLNKIEAVKSFVNQTMKYDSSLVSLDLISDRYVIDAKSILGIFSLDLTKDIVLRINTEDEKLANSIINDLVDYIV